MIYKEELHWWLNDDFSGKEVIRYKNKTVFKKNGMLHNLTGAAIRHNNGDEEYYINGVKLTDDEWNMKMRKKKIDSLIEKTKESA